MKVKKVAFLSPYATKTFGIIKQVKVGIILPRMKNTKFRRKDSALNYLLLLKYYTSASTMLYLIYIYLIYKLSLTAKRCIYTVMLRLNARGVY